MPTLPSIASATTTFKKSTVFALLRAVRDTVMGPVDRLARSVDVAGVLIDAGRPADPDRGLAAPTGLKSQPLVWLAHAHWYATAPKRRVFRLLTDLNHLS